MADPKSDAIDLEAAREKYRAERERRLRNEGEDQYIEVLGDYADFNEVDPFVEPGHERPPLNDEIEIAILGGGFSGLLTAVRLRESGVNDFRIIDAAGDFGGTWYWNRYPGAQCDIESYCYLPLLEEMGTVPTEKYARAEEIFEHTQRIGKAYDLYERACFQTRVNDLRWDEASKRWQIRTNRGDHMKARFVVMALGFYSKSKLPGIPGIDTFKGHTFHTSRWDYNYTGGDRHGNLTKLADKKVAVIGTGATAIQCVPYLGKHAEHLYVFQRTPSSVDARGNKPTDPEWAKTLKPGWQRARRENFTAVLSGTPGIEDMVNDGWTDAARRAVQGGYGKRKGSTASADDIERADFEKMSEIRARVDEIVEDPKVAELLKPWYRLFCKRPTFNDEYLPTFNRPNVTLVDVSATKGVERITETAIVANGVEYEVDCIIYATGFEATTALRRRIGFEIVGRDGVSIYDHWADGFKTLHGFMTPGFPNWFYTGRSQGALSHNFAAMIEDQARHVAHILKEVKARGATLVEPAEDAVADWVETVRLSALRGADYFDSCTPGTYNNEGQYRGGTTTEAYGGGMNAYNEILTKWRDQGDLAGIILKK